MNPQEIKLVKEEANRSKKYNAQKVRNMSIYLRMHFFHVRKQRVLCLSGSVFMGREGHDFRAVD